ncbi:P-loop containing nucleoside triphosphate hydrolase protein [Sistotremastrum niveocremeum HHB9708]|uniref:p-loop containing nucleoside triphosphate hydrolase protein n=2 Tax=Sistotremastraceae TaxID=3402574 RepID=A0A164NZH4_9AGAM|nr:P-loop containing nucleoside triphosphate hydrolase protein [Sistotremastrum niveocremeum HHB9708]KZT36527.1 P-loop containing nucleoside triphosphate hydrolase protein [Sistotremastrum suecicum HHB10207 ss-3]
MPSLPLSSALAILSFIVICITGMLPMQKTNKSFRTSPSIPNERYPNPEDTASLWQWCLWTFVNPIITLGSHRTINEDDVWKLSPYFQQKILFEKQLQYRKQYPEKSLLWFLITSNSLDLILVVILKLWVVVVGFVPPYALNRILAIIGDSTVQDTSAAYLYTLLTFVAHISFAQADLFQNYHSRRCYERARGQLFCAIHYKALNRLDLSGQSLDTDEDAPADLGKVVNIMQGDAYAVSHRFWEFANLFGAPVRLVLALIFLYQILGWSAFVGAAVLLVACGLSYPLAQWNIKITRTQWRLKDARMNAINELFQNIRFLKYYGWETRWAINIEKKREAELAWRVKENIVDTIISFMWTWVPSAVALVAFVSYTVIARQPLTVSKAFTSLALFAQLQEPMRSLPDQIFALLHAYVSMQRIQKYMQEEEVESWVSSLKRTVHSDKDKVGFEDAVVGWHAKSDVADGSPEFQLNLTVEFPKGLTLVSGGTGSGKTALLRALLGEMRLVTGSIHLQKSNHAVAYCAQHPFLEHATIRENIVFGSPRGFDQERYDAVLAACALLQDLRIFEAGDKTEIGDRGVTLSGGQKARVALARAFYSEAQTLLLDDPLAAVDIHTAQHIYENALCGDLATGRTIILVTHHVDLCLPRASYLVEMERGRISRQGWVAEMRRTGDLQAFVTNQERDPEKSEDTQLETEDPQHNVAEHEVDGRITKAESRAEGRVSLSTYLLYIRAAGWPAWILSFILVLLIRGMAFGEQFFLAKWGEAYEQMVTGIRYLRMTVLVSQAGVNLPSPNKDVSPWLLLYLIISLSSALMLLLYIALGYYASLRASRTLFMRMLTRLTRAPVSFFDTTPLGRVLNRFTTDIGTIDGAIQGSARAALSGAVNFLVSFGVIIALLPLFSPAALFIASLYVYYAPGFIKTSRDLRRLESLSLSPAFSGFDELLRGLSHIRAFAMEFRYQEEFYKKVDKFQNFDHVYWQVSGWLRFRYDWLGSIIVFATTFFALWAALPDSLAALVIVQAGIFAEASRQLVKQVLSSVGAQVELDFNAVERVAEYLHVEQEREAHGSDPPAYWPSSSGEISVEGLTVSYSPEASPALKDINFRLRGGEKVALVGRTGSGKSTLALSFLRIVEAAKGSITMDGIDISKISLERLRNSVTLVSQDVSMFSGSVRDNLDPLAEVSDHDCWEILKRCHLVTSNSNQQGPIQNLETQISAQGSLSAGERQLLALARAVLRRSRIIILDEATSHMSHELDEQIQTIIQEDLREATIIAIAHRLKSTLHYDRVMVLQEGQIMEFDDPQILLKNPERPPRACRPGTDLEMFSGRPERARTMCLANIAQDLIRSIEHVYNYKGAKTKTTNARQGGTRSENNASWRRQQKMSLDDD